jgi:hypothetical protein
MSARSPTTVARAWRLVRLACIASACIGPARALPLDPGVTRELNFLSYYSMCTGNLPLGGDNMSCDLTNGDSLVAAHADHYGSPSSGIAHAFANGLDITMSATTTRFTAPTVYLDAVQFDQLTITGPTPTVNVGVKVTIDGTTAQNAPGYVSGLYSFSVGTRSATPNASANSTGDRINSQTRLLG